MRYTHYIGPVSIGMDRESTNLETALRELKNSNGKIIYFSSYMKDYYPWYVLVAEVNDGNANNPIQDLY